MFNSTSIFYALSNDFWKLLCKGSKANCFGETFNFFHRYINAAKLYVDSKICTRTNFNTLNVKNALILFDENYSNILNISICINLNILQIVCHTYYLHTL